MLRVTSTNTATSIPAVVVPCPPPAPSLHRFTWMRDAGIPISDHAHPSLPTSLETLHLHRKPTDWHLLLKNNFTDMGEKHTWKESWTP